MGFDISYFLILKLIKSAIQPPALDVLCAIFSSKYYNTEALPWQWSFTSCYFVWFFNIIPTWEFHDWILLIVQSMNRDFELLIYIFSCLVGVTFGRRWWGGFLNVCAHFLIIRLHLHLAGNVCCAPAVFRASPVISPASHVFPKHSNLCQLIYHNHRDPIGPIVPRDGSYPLMNALSVRNSKHSFV